MSVRVMMYVQHLLGVGHVKRAAAVARGIGDTGIEVTVAMGGMPVPFADFGSAQVIQLPPVRSADAGFSRLVDEDEREIDDTWWARREAALMDAYERVQPNVLLTEHFPFGRRKFRRELIPLFKHARDRTKIVSSVRDILVESSDPDKTAKMVNLARVWFDCILVHGDPNVVRLDETFPPAAGLADLIRYTGYVLDGTNAQIAENQDGYGEVIVSAGGGAVGETLFRTALEARIRGCLSDRVWRFLAGANLDDAVLSDLQRTAPAGVIVERARPDFPALLVRAGVSISQGGYNTIMDLMVAGCPAVVVPFATGGETEQTRRAERFQDRGLLHMVHETDLSPTRLATAVEDALAQGPPDTNQSINLDGALTTGRLLDELIRGR